MKFYSICINRALNKQTNKKRGRFLKGSFYPSRLKQYFEICLNRALLKSNTYIDISLVTE